MGLLSHAASVYNRWDPNYLGNAGGDALHEFAHWLTNAAESPVRAFPPADADIDSVIDVHGVFRGSHHDVDVTTLPSILLPTSGPLGLQDWEKAWSADAADDIFERRGIATEGAIVVVRPDQYVAHVLPLTARGELTEFFAGFLLPA